MSHRFRFCSIVGTGPLQLADSARFTRATIHTADLETRGDVGIEPQGGRLGDRKRAPAMRHMEAAAPRFASVNAQRQALVLVVDRRSKRLPCMNDRRADVIHPGLEAELFDVEFDSGTPGLEFHSRTRGHLAPRTRCS